MNDEQIKKKKKIKVSLLHRTVIILPSQYTFLVVHLGNHCQLAGLFLLLAQWQQDIASTASYKGLPDPNVTHGPWSWAVQLCRLPSTMPSTGRQPAAPEPGGCHCLLTHRKLELGWVRDWPTIPCWVIASGCPRSTGNLNMLKLF